MLIEHPPRFWRSLVAPEALWRFDAAGPGEQPRVFLTFDDGPVEGTTPWLLDTLDRLEVRGTFFMVADNVRRYAGLMERVLEAGHSVGNHTYHHLPAHRYPGCRQARRYMEDVREAGRLIPGRLFRPPHGTLLPSHREMLAREGWVTVMYDVVTRDYSRRLCAAEVVENVRRYVSDGSIVVFHDSLRSIERLRTALPEAVAWLRDRGYRFDVIDMETGLPKTK